MTFLKAITLEKTIKKLCGKKFYYIVFQLFQIAVCPTHALCATYRPCTKDLPEKKSYLCYVFYSFFFNLFIHICV